MDGFVLGGDDGPLAAGGVRRQAEACPTGTGKMVVGAHPTSGSGRVYSRVAWMDPWQPVGGGMGSHRVLDAPDALFGLGAVASAGDADGEGDVGVGCGGFGAVGAVRGERRGDRC